VESFAKKPTRRQKISTQHSVGAYILDFYCPEEHLAIELDGQQHFTESGQGYDLERTRYLEALNIRVLRFENNNVFHYIDEVLNDIQKSFRS
jgi:very-short-patch-repair endonuclease